MSRVFQRVAGVLGITAACWLSPAVISAGTVQSNDATLSGDVVDPQGQRIAGAAVVLVLDSGEARETASNARGEFRVEDVPAGSHSLTVASTGFEPRTMQIDVGASGAARVTVELDIVGISAQLTVTAPSPDGYGAPRAAAATRLNIPVIETPFSVQVVPLRVMEDQNALGLEEVYANVSGVVEAGNTLNAQTEIRPIIRGFEAAVPLRNGLRATTVGAVDLINIESVEVLKGPASILYGALEPGGVVNLTTKKPLMAPRYEFGQQFGSYGHSRTTLDVTGTLNTRRTIAYRVNAAYQDSDSFRNAIDLDRLAFMPSVTFRPDERNELFVDFSYSRERVPYDSGVPFGRNLQDHFTSIGYFRQLQDNVTVRTQFQFHRVHALNESIRHRGVRGRTGSEVLRRRYQNEDRTDDDYQLVADVISTFDLGATSHQALVGFDLAYQDSTFLGVAGPRHRQLCHCRSLQRDGAGRARCRGPARRRASDADGRSAAFRKFRRPAHQAPLVPRRARDLDIRIIGVPHLAPSYRPEPGAPGSAGRWPQPRRACRYVRSAGPGDLRQHREHRHVDRASRAGDALNCDIGACCGCQYRGCRRRGGPEPGPFVRMGSRGRLRALYGNRRDRDARAVSISTESRVMAPRDARRACRRANATGAIWPAAISSSASPYESDRVEGVLVQIGLSEQ